MLLSASANALKLCNVFYDPSVSYIDLHTLHKRALPSKFCIYKHCVLLHKVFNNSIPKRDWLDLNFQMVNTSRQTSFEIQNRSVYEVGNSILSNCLTCINKKFPLIYWTWTLVLYKLYTKTCFWNENCNLYWSLLVFNYILLFYFILFHTVSLSFNNDV